ncbi:LOW QUALITY PROTEIN: hypothetical protein KUTeg_022028 [Tegillarca granosa]|uniref:SWIM-type domain-containing protein n=1 Tax=Tegillarca granosa TaxID=220873 RepID=A0ABQ9E822_TEGGR|nr:LOW QUALITY PROTEIN: hypothetical protein KUTeg_022028 [Tegillarca granosa]
MIRTILVLAEAGKLDSDRYQPPILKSKYRLASWNLFPSVNLPNHFNHGQIHHHIVESVQFINNNELSDEDDDIDDLHTAKPMKKGKDFFKSGHVQAMKDCERNGKYFLKAKVMASYNAGAFYDTNVQISKESGFMRHSCVASCMGHCSHVSALLFALEDFIENYGTDCTSRKCEWNKGRTKERNPKRVAETDYASVKKKRINDIEAFDPTPGYSSRTSKETVSDLLYVMEHVYFIQNVVVFLLECPQYDYYHFLFHQLNPTMESARRKLPS